MPTSEDMDSIVSATLTAYRQHLDPALVKQTLLLADDFIEWQAEGVYITDVRNRRYLDAGSAGGVFGLGHRHPRVMAAVRAQLDLMPQPSRMGLNPVQASLADKLTALTPGNLKYVYVATSGTEAIEAALKMARLVTGRSQIVSTLNSFHGMSIAASSVSGLPYFRDGFAPLLGECIQVPYGDVDAMRQVVGPRTAAVLVEPVQAGSGCTVPPPGYLRALREMCDRSGAMLVADEIQTALGRTGAMFACDHEGVAPDLLCLGKILGGGVMPIGCTVFTPRIMEVLSNRPLFNNSTFGGNQMACAAAGAALDVIREDRLVERAVVLGRRLDDSLRRLQSRYPQVVGGLKGIGLMRCVQLSDPRQAFVVIPRLIRKHRIIVITPANQAHLIRINPPLIISDEELDAVVAALDESLAEADRFTPADLDRLLDDLRRQLSA